MNDKERAAAEQPVEQVPDVQDVKDASNEEKKSKRKHGAELEALKTELAEIKDRLLRTAAEFDNYRKRTEREKAASVSYGCANAIDKLLPVLDTLEMAAGAESSDAEYKKGVSLTIEVFKRALDSLGVTEIEAEGMPFDPELHSAVMRAPREGVESGTVVTVLQKGYKMNDRVIRHAVVAVAE